MGRVALLLITIEERKKEIERLIQRLEKAGEGGKEERDRQEERKERKE